MKTFIVTLIALLFSFNVVANDTGAWFDPAQDGHGISLYEWNEGRVFWWFTFDEDGERNFFFSSVEEGEDFLLYAPTVENPDFPTGAELVAGEPIGTATLVELEAGGFLFTWDLLVEEVTCGDKYGPVPFGPWDPACVYIDENGERRFDGDRVLVEDYDEQGSARFVRLTPAQ